MTAHRVVVAIDLGTHGTGYAWAETGDLDDDGYRSPIRYQERWPGASELAYPKNLSAVLVDASGAVVAWGFEAENAWNDLLQSGSTAGHGYAYAFKMALSPHAAPEAAVAHGSIDLSDRPTVLRLMSAYLGEIARTALADIEHGGWSAQHVRWCITVPAIWDDVDRDLVRRAAVSAGLPPDEERLVVAVEPEAAALYCSTRPVNVLNDDSEDTLPLRREGTRFMVVDCGGGTVDLTAHRTVPDGEGGLRLDDIGRPTGGSLGSAHLNHAFRTTVLTDRFGEDVMRVLEHEQPAGLVAIERSWEAAKVGMRAEDDESGAPRIVGTARISVPVDVWEALGTATRDRLIERAGGHKARIVVGSAEVARLLDGVVDPILERIEDQLAEMQRVTGVVGDEIILVVGGFARSGYLLLRVRERFAGRATVMTPLEPAAAVLFGAVHYGHAPQRIRVRRATHTYGFGVSRPFEPDRDPPAKRTISDHDQRAHCKGRFEVAVRRGDPVEADRPHSIVVVPKDRDAPGLPVDFYATEARDPRYVDDRGCRWLGRIDIDVSGTVGRNRSERRVELAVYFGRTTIQVEARTVATREVVTAEIEYRAAEPAAARVAT